MMVERGQKRRKKFANGESFFPLVDKWKFNISVANITFLFMWL
jgi:hypothetical protein